MQRFPNSFIEVDGNFTTTQSQKSILGDITLVNKPIRPPPPLSSQGLLWTNNQIPNNLIFTDNRGSDHIISSGGGGVSLVNTGAGLIGGPITTTGTISIPNNGITNAMILNDAITINTLGGISGGGTVALGSAITLTGSPTGVSQVNTGQGLIGGPITTTGTISIPNNGITNAMLFDDEITINTSGGLTGGGVVALGGAITITGAGAVLPAVSNNIYVTKYGNDLTGTGSFVQPFASLVKAASVANVLAGPSSSVTIYVATGTYIEDNSSGPINFTSPNITIVGASAVAVTMISNTPSNDFITANSNLVILNLTMFSLSPLGTAITVTAGGLTAFYNLHIINFLVGMNCSGIASDAYSINGCVFISNGTGLIVNDVVVSVSNTGFIGQAIGTSIPANTAIIISGATCTLLLGGGIVATCETGLIFTNNSNATINAMSFKNNKFDVIQNTSSSTTFTSCTFEITSDTSDIDLQISGAGTTMELIGIEFNGRNVLGVPEAVGILITDNAIVNITSCTMSYYETAIQIGTLSDTFSTTFTASSCILRECANDIVQSGSTSINFNASTASNSKITISDPTNVNMSFFNLDDGSSLTIGPKSDVDITLLQANTLTAIKPQINYKTNLYNSNAIGIQFDDNTSASSFTISNGDVANNIITSDRTKYSSINLYSDEGSPIGGTSALRGWNIKKNSTSGELAFDYQNTDIVGQITVPNHTVMQLDGLNDRLQLPSTTSIVFAGDTNLYRSSANVLKTDDNFIVDTLTPDRVVVTNSLTNQLESSNVTTTELNNLSGVISSIQTQLDDKVNKSGDTMTGTLTTPTLNTTNLTSTNSTLTNATITTLSSSSITSSNINSTTATIPTLNSTNINAIDIISDTITSTDMTVDTLSLIDTGVNTISLLTPATIPSSYALTLPQIAPTTGQTLRAGQIIASNLTWVSEGGSAVPTSSRIVYVTKYGNDTTGDGSFDLPFASLSKAITTANSISSVSTPVTILIYSGLYVENNSSGPFSITSGGISVVGATRVGTIILPSTPGNDFINATTTVLISNITFQSSTPSATCLTLSGGTLSVIENVRVVNFLVGALCVGGVNNSFGFNYCTFIANTTAVISNNAYINANGCILFGSSTLTGPSANSGLLVTGSAANVIFSGGIIGVLITGVTLTNSSLSSFSGISFRLNTFDIVQTTAARSIISDCIFEQSTGITDIDIKVSDVGTIAEIDGCEFNGNSISGIPRGICLEITDNASVSITSGTIRNYTTGIHVGLVTDTNSTSVFTSGLSIKDCVTNDILQEGSSSLVFTSGSTIGSKISVSDSTNVCVAFFDLSENNVLTIGTFADVDTPLIQTNISGVNRPEIVYRSDIYGTQSIGYANYTTDSTLFSLSNNATNTTVITTDRTQTSTLSLYSDENSPVGTTTALRGWNIMKNGGNSELAFKYQNTDIVGQIAVPLYTVMQLDGLNNTLQLPTSTLLFGADTNLYRSSANVLKTDDNFIINTLTPGRVITTNNGTNQLETSLTTSTELGYLSGVTSSIQTQINAKVNKSGDTMTGTLFLPAGTTALPSISFTGSSTTGFSATSSILSISTNALERINISSSGVVSILNLSTTGVVHNDSLGVLTTSLIVNADITNSTITNAKLATISSTNVSGNIVVRDGFGNFAANIVTINGTITNPTDAATKAYVDAAISTGLVAKTPAVVVSISNETLSGTPIIDGIVLFAGNRVLLTGQTNPIENGLWEAQVGAWIRPIDFDTGDTAGQAYVLITSGVIYGGSSWLCNTPTAIIDTDPVNFALFSLPNVTTAANVGIGSGMIFKNKTSNTLNFRSLLSGTHISIITNTDDISFTVDAVSTNTANTIVSRDASGNFTAGTITASLTGSASNNVLKIGDTMTGTLFLPPGSSTVPTLSFTGGTSGISSTSNVLSLITNSLERFNINASGEISILNLTSTGIVHNNASGLLTTSLIVDADISALAEISDTKLATITSVGKVANTATTATNLNTASTIVSRDASGNFNAGIIVASLTGAASANVLKSGDTMTGILVLPAGNSTTPTLTFTGSLTSGFSATTGTLSFITNSSERIRINSGGTISINAFTSSGVVHNDISGNLSSSLIVDSDISASAAITDSKLATITTTGKVNNSATTATNTNNPLTIVSRDGSGNFSAGTITASLNGNASTATTATTATNATNATNFTGNLLGDVTGTQSATVVDLVGGQTAANVSSATILANASTSLNTALTIVRRDVSGDFSAGIITANLNGNATSSTTSITSTDFTGNLLGDVTGIQSATVVSLVGGQSASNIAAATVLANASTSLNIASTIVRRDASGNFNAGIVIANLTGSASNNVLKAGDTMTGTLILPAGNTTTPSLSFTGSLLAGLSATTGSLSFITNSLERLNISSGGILSVKLFTVAGVVHNDASGNLSSSLIVNSDISNSAAITDSKLATISTSGKVSNSATTATSSNVISTIVSRDGSGNFSAGTITASLNGNATSATSSGSFSGNLLGDVTGTQSATVVSLVGGQSATNVANGSVLANASTNLNTPLAIVRRDASGNFVAGTITGNLSGNATTSTSTSNFLGILPIVNGGTGISTTPTNGRLLIGNGTGYTSANLTQGSYVVINNGLGSINIGVQDASDIVGGAVSIGVQTFAGIKTMKDPLLLNTVFGTDASSSLSIQPDGRVIDNGAFSFGFPVSSIIGNFPISAPNLSGTNTGNVTFNTVGAVPNASGASLVGQAITLQPADGLNPGLVSTGMQSFAGSKTFLSAITGSLLGNATTSTSFTGNLSGDVTGTQSATVVSLVGGQTATNVASGSVLANASTNLNTPSTIVRRDASGDFSAGIITATLNGNASSTTNFSGILLGDVTGTQNSTVVSTVGGESASNIASATILANDATNLNTASTIVRRDASGNFVAGVITANLTGSASNNVLKSGDTMTGTLILPAGSATVPSLSFTGSLTSGLSAVSGDLMFLTNGLERFTVSSTGVINISSFIVGGIVHNDASGNLSSSLIVNADISASAAIADTKLATISTAGKVSNSATTAVTTNTASTIVLRDGAGSFSANVVNAVTSDLSGNLVLAAASTSTTGNILKGANRFIHNFGTNNTFVGVTSGNFTTTGTGRNSVFGSNSTTLISNGANNSAFGYNTFASLTSGSTNIAIGSGAGGTLTTGSGNIYINANAGVNSEATTTRIGTSQNRCFIAGIRGITTGQPNGITVLIDSNGQLGTVFSSIKYKQNICDMLDVSERVLKLDPKTFTYISDETNTIQYGLIAEEVLKVFPELVVYDDHDNVETVKYQILPILMLNEMKKQKNIIDDQQIRIKRLEEELVNQKLMLKKILDKLQI